MLVAVQRHRSVLIGGAANADWKKKQKEKERGKQKGETGVRISITVLPEERRIPQPFLLHKIPSSKIGLNWDN